MTILKIYPNGSSPLDESNVIFRKIYLGFKMDMFGRGNDENGDVYNLCQTRKNITNNEIENINNKLKKNNYAIIVKKLI